MSAATKTIARMVGLVGDELELSPRQALRTAISAHAAAKAELEMLQATVAYDGAASVAIRTLETEAEEKHQALVASQRGTATAFVQRALGQPEDVGVPIGQARSELQTIKDELLEARNAKRHLEEMIPAAEDREYWCGRKVSDAARAVIVAEVLPHAQKIWAEYDRIMRSAQEVSQVVSWLRTEKAIGASPFPTEAVNKYDGAAVWRQAEAALHVDADYQLPAFPGIGAVVSAKR